MQRVWPAPWPLCSQSPGTLTSAFAWATLLLMCALLTHPKAERHFYCLNSDRCLVTHKKHNKSLSLATR